MAIFNIQFGGKRGGASKANDTAFNTPFLKIGKGNLSLPYVQTTVHGTNVIYFGQNNLFPQILNQQYFTSPLHSAIVDFTINAVIGGGVDIKLKEDNADNQIDLRIFKNRTKLDKMFRVLMRDYYLHSRAHVIIKYSQSGKYLTMRRVDPSQIRYRFDGHFEYCEDWSTNRNRKTFPKWSPVKPSGEMMLTFQDESPGQDYYPIPPYSSALNWCFLDGEQSFLHKNNIQNSIFPSIIIRKFSRFKTKKDRTEFKDNLTGNKGAEGAGRVMVLAGDGRDNTPEASAVNVNQNDKLFIQTSKSIQDNICFAHKINPSIMGIKVAGSLGNAQELEMSYGIWEKNVVFPLRDIGEEMGQKLLQIAGIEGVFDIEEYRLIGGQVIEEATPQAELSADFIGQLSEEQLMELKEKLNLVL